MSDCDSCDSLQYDLGLTGNSLVEGSLGHLASLVGRVEDLVVKHGEVEREAETNGVRGREVGAGDFGRGLVRLQGLVGGVLALVGHGELGQVAVVVTLPVRKSEKNALAFEHRMLNAHLVVEDFGLAALSGWDEVLVENLEDVLTDLSELGLDLLAVLLDKGDLLLVALGLLLLLDRGDDAPRRTAGADDVLVGDRQEIPLLDGELLVCGGNILHVLHHFCALRQHCKQSSQGGVWLPS